MTTLDDSSICLFCNQKANSLMEYQYILYFIYSNLSHMNAHHSFFISDKMFCNNMEDLLDYLAEKINIGKLCLFCNTSKNFKTADAVRHHMV
jgi:pre-60S factor REI1